jgi:hypothetical protein
MNSMRVTAWAYVTGSKAELQQSKKGRRVEAALFFSHQVSMAVIHAFSVSMILTPY